MDDGKIKFRKDPTDPAGIVLGSKGNRKFDKDTFKNFKDQYPSDYKKFMSYLNKISITDRKKIEDDINLPSTSSSTSASTSSSTSASTSSSTSALAPSLAPAPASSSTSAPASANQSVASSSITTLSPIVSPQSATSTATSTTRSTARTPARDTGTALDKSISENFDPITSNEIQQAYQQIRGLVWKSSIDKWTQTWMPIFQNNFNNYKHNDRCIIAFAIRYKIAKLQGTALPGPRTAEELKGMDSIAVPIYPPPKNTSTSINRPASSGVTVPRQSKSSSLGSGVSTVTTNPVKPASKPTTISGFSSTLNHPLNPVNTPPAATQLIPTQPVPAATQPVPAPTQPVPAPTLPVPATTQPVPAPTQPVPATTQPVPAPTQPCTSSNTTCTSSNTTCTSSNTTCTSSNTTCTSSNTTCAYFRSTNRRTSGWS